MNKRRLCTAAASEDSKNADKISSSMKDRDPTGLFAFSDSEVGALVAGQSWC
jgi:hypothetical protein